MEDTIKLLDHGYVRYIESWGRGLDGRLEAGIVEAARQSTQGGFKGWGTPDAPGDEKLLAYLATHKHTTPFEFAGCTFEVQAPILVFREWHRHRTQSYSEASARYEPIPNVNYLPTRERIIEGAQKAGRNRQAQGTAPLLIEAIDDWLKAVDAAYEGIEQTYQTGLAIGIPKEVARVVMPVGRYSKMRVSTDLWNWLHFLTLRTAPDAQWEIRQYANAVESLLSQLFPRTLELWNDMVHGPA